MRVFLTAVLVVALTAGAAARVFAQSTAPVLVDRDMSAGAGAVLMATFGEAVARAENTVVPHRLFDERGAGRRAANVGYRLGRFLFFDAPQEQFVMVVNHELFGHGARLREQFNGPIGYQFHRPAPYGPGSASTMYVFDRLPTPTERLSVHAGGMEASGVAAAATASRALQRGSMTARDALRYVQFELDTLGYVFSTDDGEEPGHDVADFLATYNALALETGADLLSARTLKRQALASLANPMLGYAAWSIGRYLATGEDAGAIPTLSLGGVHYLPLMRYRLTPFGTEWALVNELAGSIRPTQVELRVGHAPNARPWGLSVRHREIPAWGEWLVDVGVAVWRQPEFGAQVRGRLQRPLVPVWFSTEKAALIVDVGAKGEGYVPGEPLGAGPVIRAGIGLPLGR
jgi:hypothetical protein